MKKGWVIVLVLLSALTLVSLALNGVVIYGLFRANKVALATVVSARAILGGVRDGTFSYTLTVDQDMPISASVPVNHEVSVPIHTTLPISSVVDVPVDAGLLGTFDVEVPVQTIVPVDLEVAVPVSETVEIATTVSLNTRVPIEIPIADTSLGTYLEEIDAALEEVELQLMQFEVP
jgi:hypothetical protein